MVECQPSKLFVESSSLSTRSGVLLTMWRIWAKALGQKDGRTDREADMVALVRTLIVLVYLVTNFVIMAGVVRHW